jgi:hypothetical protein
MTEEAAAVGRRSTPIGTSMHRIVGGTIRGMKNGVRGAGVVVASSAA